MPQLVTFSVRSPFTEWPNRAWGSAAHPAAILPGPRPAPPGAATASAGGQESREGAGPAGGRAGVSPRRGRLCAGPAPPKLGHHPGHGHPEAAQHGPVLAQGWPSLLSTPQCCPVLPRAPALWCPLPPGHVEGLPVGDRPQCPTSPQLHSWGSPQGISHLRTRHPLQGGGDRAPGKDLAPGIPRPTWPWPRCLRSPTGAQLQSWPRARRPVPPLPVPQ